VPVLVVPNAVPLSAIAASDGTPLPDGSPPLLLFAGRLSPEKNLRLLIRALSRVLRRVEAGALICGDGIEERMLRDLVSSLGMTDMIRIAGYRTDLWSVMKQAAVFVSVTRIEGHPNTVLEAMACRCPLIVSDIAEHREFLDATTARFADPIDAGSVADAIESVLQDLGAARVRADAAFERVQSLTAERCADGYDAAYLRVTRKR
jgi:glycosyltransferase involved in cell wall biosynthesis